MNGPTMRLCAWGSARRTVNPPRSAVRGMITRSMASHAGASPAIGSLAGKKLIGAPHGRGDNLLSYGVNVTGKHQAPGDCGKIVVPRALDRLLHVQRLRPDRPARRIEGDFFHPGLG